MVGCDERGDGEKVGRREAIGPDQSQYAADQPGERAELEQHVLVEDAAPEELDGHDQNVLSRAKDRRKRITQSQKQFGDIGWTKGYINISVSVFSKMHRSIFQKIDGEYYTGRGFADVLLGYQIKRNGFSIHELPYKFNHMTMFSEPWNGSPSRFDSHIIHYAGAGIFEKGKGLSREQQMKKDYARAYP